MTGILNILAGALGVAKDTYFNLVSLLLPGNGTNGAQNNTFLDSSTNNFTITRNGNTTQGTFSPFSQTGWGNYFDGSNDYLSIANNSAFNISSGDFTLETWINLNSFPSAGNTEGLICITDTSISSYASVTLRILIKSDGKIQINAGSSSTGTSTPLFDITSVNAVSLNTFTHIAFARSGSTLVLYINGKAEATTTTSATFYWDASKVFHIASSGGGSISADGYFSNLRLVTSQALFTGSTLGTTYFTPSIQPLTTSSIGATGSGVAASLTGTVALLTCQANRFRDASSSNLTITANNGAAVVPFSPFAPTAAYTTAAVGGSGYFDGTGDYLETPSNSSFDLSAGDWTIDAWFYMNATGNYPQVWSIGNANSANYALLCDQNTRRLDILRNGGLSFTIATIDLSTWYHVAIVCQSGTVRAYLNGVQTGGTSTSLPPSGSVKFSVGGRNFSDIGAGSYWNGFISNVRVVKGTAVYTGAFTPPIAPVSTSGSASSLAYPSTTNINTSFASSACSLLLNYTNAGITDATAKNDLETVGNAQISTSVSKFGGGSIAFDGTGDWLVIPSSNLFILGTGDFTIEAWGYPSVVGGGGLSRGLFQITSSAGFSTSATNSLAVATTNPSGNWGCIAANAFNNSSTAAVVNTWYHLALVRNSGTTKLYVNGTSVLSFADTTNYTCTFLTIGGYYDTNNIWNGYIDDFRITKGVARYTGSTYTVPTAPFPVQ